MKDYLKNVTLDTYYVLTLIMMSLLSLIVGIYLEFEDNKHLVILHITLFFAFLMIAIKSINDTVRGKIYKDFFEQNRPKMKVDNTP